MVRRTETDLGEEKCAVFLEGGRERLFCSGWFGPSPEQNTEPPPTPQTTPGESEAELRLQRCWRGLGRWVAGRWLGIEVRAIREWDPGVGGAVCQPQEAFGF